MPDKNSMARSKKPPTTTRVLLVHHVGLLRLGVRFLIGGMAGFEVCGETDDVPTARQLFERRRPHLAVVGHSLHRGDGLQLVKEFRKMDPTATILMLSAGEDAPSVLRALNAGVRGYLRIYDADVEFPKALERICAGKVYVSEHLKDRFFEHAATGKIKSARTRDDSLSDREREVFFLTGKGFGVSEMAKEMNVSVKTVETHQGRIKKKLGLGSIAALREKAVRAASKSDWQRMGRN